MLSYLYFKHKFDVRVFGGEIPRIFGSINEA